MAKEKKVTKKTVERLGMAHITKAISAETEIPQATIKKVIDSLTTVIIISTLKEGNVLALRGFGVFKAKDRKPRKFKTGEQEYDVPACTALTFKASSGLKIVH